LRNGSVAAVFAMQLFRLFWLVLPGAIATGEYCNTNLNICDEFDEDFNVAELSEIKKWWEEMERNVRPIKCEFLSGEEVEQGGRRYANCIVYYSIPDTKITVNHTRISKH
jgi:hypothetical protein